MRGVSVRAFDGETYSLPTGIIMARNKGTDGVTPVITVLDAGADPYDLSGRRVANPQRGIYIMPGRKIYR